MRARPVTTLGALALLACGASAPPAAEAPPAEEPAPAAVTSPTACTAPSECRLVWTVDDVCGCCGEPRRPHVEALSGAAATERLAVGCPACECAAETTMLATCEAGRCAVVDLLASELTACTTDDECVLVGHTCGIPSEAASVRRGEEATHAALLGCTPRPPDLIEGLPAPRALCLEGHCRVASE